MSYGEKIKATALKYVGETEISGNAGFNDRVFEAKMIATGWAKFASWCAYFGELVWTEAYLGSKYAADLPKLFSGSATATFKNFDLDPNWETSTDTPRIGALAIWREGNGWRGHLAAAVIAFDLKAGTFDSVEGNTNSAGGREGIEVAVKTGHKIKKPYNAKGLNLVGFVWPREDPATFV